MSKKTVSANEALADKVTRFNELRRLFHARAASFNDSFFAWAHSLDDPEAGPAIFYEKGLSATTAFDDLVDASRQIAEFVQKVNQKKEDEKG